MNIDKYLEEGIRKIPELIKKYENGKKYDLDYNNVRKYYGNLDPSVKYVDLSLKKEEGLKKYTPDIYLGYKMIKENFYGINSTEEIVNKYFPEIKKNHQDVFEEKTSLFKNVLPVNCYTRAQYLYQEAANIFRKSIPILNLYLKNHFNNFLIEKYNLQFILDLDNDLINRSTYRKTLYLIISELPIFEK